MKSVRILDRPSTLVEGSLYYRIQKDLNGVGSVEIVEFIGDTSSPEVVIIRQLNSPKREPCSRFELFLIPPSLLCPECENPTLVYEEGCFKCYSCWYAEC